MGKKCFWLTMAFLGMAALSYFLLSRKNDISEELDHEFHYVGNTTTMKLHLPSCRALPDPEIRAYFTSRQEAIASGYSPCGICKP